MNTTTPLLRFGVASDLHVTDWASAEILCRDFVNDEALGEPWILPRKE